MFSGLPAGEITTLSPMRAFLSMMAFSMRAFWPMPMGGTPRAVTTGSFHDALNQAAVERLHERRYATLEALRTDVADYIERFCNRQRRHSTLGYLSPAIYELCHAA